MKRYFITGLLVWIPLAITVWVLAVIVRTLDQTLLLLPASLQPGTLIGFTAPGMYNAVRRAADGLRDPETGTFNGLSAAYEMEGVAAFIPPEQHQVLARGGAFPPAR